MSEVLVTLRQHLTFARIAQDVVDSPILSSLRKAYRVRHAKAFR